MMDILESLRRALLVLSALVGLCYMYQTMYLILPFFRRRHAPAPAAHAPARRYAVLIGTSRRCCPVCWTASGPRPGRRR